MSETQTDPKLPSPVKVWVCDACGDLAECEPGDECEVCAEGTIQVVEYVPLSVAEDLAEALSEVPLADSAPGARRWWEDLAKPALARSDLLKGESDGAN